MIDDLGRLVANSLREVDRLSQVIKPLGDEARRIRGIAESVDSAMDALKLWVDGYMEANPTTELTERLEDEGIEGWRGYFDYHIKADENDEIEH